MNWQRTGEWPSTRLKPSRDDCQTTSLPEPLRNAAASVALSQGREGGTDNLRMKQVEYWRWRYCDPKTGRMCRTMFQLTAEEAAKYPDAERIAGSMLLRDVDEDEDTEPAVFCSDATTPSPDAKG